MSKVFVSSSLLFGGVGNGRGVAGLAKGGDWGGGGGVEGGGGEYFHI